jgi:hypothetical protein
MLGLPTFEPNVNHYGPAHGLTAKPGIDFTCYAQVCALKTIRMSDGSLVYAIPDKPWAEKARRSRGCPSHLFLSENEAGWTTNSRQYGSGRGVPDPYRGFLLMRWHSPPERVLSGWR